MRTPYFTSEDLPDFKFGDLVRIKSGFYEGCEGVLKNKYATHKNSFYEVEGFKKCDSGVFLFCIKVEDSNLEKVKDVHTKPTGNKKDIIVGKKDNWTDGDMP